jgi:hypothetical protein
MGGLAGTRLLVPNIRIAHLNNRSCSSDGTVWGKSNYQRGSKQEHYKTTVLQFQATAAVNAQCPHGIPALARWPANLSTGGTVETGLHDPGKYWGRVGACTTAGGPVDESAIHSGNHRGDPRIAELPSRSPLAGDQRLTVYSRTYALAMSFSCPLLPGVTEPRSSEPFTRLLSPGQGVVVWRCDSGKAAQSHERDPTQVRQSQHHR